MTTSSVFTCNPIQVVCLPGELRFPDGVTRVEVRAVGNERIITPVDQSWDGFFLAGEIPSEDFMADCY